MHTLAHAIVFIVSICRFVVSRIRGRVLFQPPFFSNGPAYRAKARHGPGCDAIVIVLSLWPGSPGPVRPAGPPAWRRLRSLRPRRTIRMRPRYGSQWPRLPLPLVGWGPRPHWVVINSKVVDSGFQSNGARSGPGPGGRTDRLGSRDCRVTVTAWLSVTQARRPLQSIRVEGWHAFRRDSATTTAVTPGGDWRARPASLSAAHRQVTVPVLWLCSDGLGRRRARRLGNSPDRDPSQLGGSAEL